MHPANLHYAVHDVVPTDLTETVDEGLDGANSNTASLSAVQPLACSCRLGDGRIIGGAVGRTWGACSELQQIWVAPDFRRNGIATRLLIDFTSKAQSRGCKTLYLETFSFQCPSLYLDHGFEIAATFEGFPDGIKKYIMVLSIGGALN